MAILTWDGSQYRDIAGLQAGDEPAQHAYVWDGSQYVAVWSAWSNKGISKQGTQQLPRSQWTLITGWVIRSGYPGTVIESNGIRVEAGSYTISAQVTCTSPFPLYQTGVRVVLDGSPISGLNPGPASGSSVASVSATVQIGGGLVQVEGYSGFANANDRIAQPTTTWLTIEKP